jgi:hypothetical protein
MLCYWSVSRLADCYLQRSSRNLIIHHFFFFFAKITNFQHHKIPLNQSETGSVEVLIKNAKYSDEGDYLCYAYPADRTVYEVKAINVVVGKL